MREYHPLVQAQPTPLLIKTTTATVTSSQNQNYLVLDPGLEAELKQGEFRISEEDGEAEEIDPENTPLSFPSNMDLQDLRRCGLELAADLEVEIRKAQLHGILESLRAVLGSRTLMFSKVIKNVKSQATRGRAWASVNEYTRERNLLVRQYHRSRHALELLLGTDHPLLDDTFKPILPEELKVTADIVEINRLGQKNDRLPWFWRLQGDDLVEGSPVMTECESICCV